MTMDLDIVMVIFYQRFLWRFQKHITLGVFIVFWKNRNLKQESHLNLHCWSIWYFLNPPPPVLFTLNERNYFTTTSWHEFFFIKVYRCYSADKYYFSAEYLLTILLNSCTRNNSASANHFCAGSFPPITNHISLPFDLLLPPHSPDLNRSSRSKGNRSSRPKRPWNNRYFIEKTRWHSLLLLRNITLKRKCTKANFFLEIVSSVLFHIQ